jgi:hypothetical protein
MRAHRREQRGFANTRLPMHEERRAVYMDMIDELLKRLKFAFATDEGLHARSPPPSQHCFHAEPWLNRSIGPQNVHRIAWTTS